MPELPEVQTVVDDLNRKIKGDLITGFWTEWEKGVRKPLRLFKKEIEGRKITGIERLGKFILINLADDKAILIHLRMTGHLLVKSEGRNAKSETRGRDYFSDRVNQYIRHIFYLKSGRKIEFSDVRKFGKIIVANKNEINSLAEIKNLGMDVMSPEFIFSKFDSILGKRPTKIKALLLDQSQMAGIGNIYASEILHEAGVRPDLPAGQISSQNRKKIYSAIRKVMKKAIKMRGTSDSDYRDTSGAPGNFQKVLKVYRKAGKKCRSCDTIIKRSVIGQRSTFYCPNCQK